MHVTSHHNIQKTKLQHIYLSPLTKLDKMAENNNNNNNTTESKETDLKSGPFNVLYKAVKGNTQVLINVRNNHKLLGRVKAYDRHMNL